MKKPRSNMRYVKPGATRSTRLSRKSRAHAKTVKLDFQNQMCVNSTSELIAQVDVLVMLLLKRSSSANPPTPKLASTSTSKSLRDSNKMQKSLTWKSRKPLPISPTISPASSMGGPHISRRWLRRRSAKMSSSLRTLPTLSAAPSQSTVHPLAKSLSR